MRLAQVPAQRPDMDAWTEGLHRYSAAMSAAMDSYRDHAARAWHAYLLEMNAAAGDYEARVQAAGAAYDATVVSLG